MLPSNPHGKNGRAWGAEGRLYAWPDGSEADPGAPRDFYFGLGSASNSCCPPPSTPSTRHVVSLRLPVRLPQQASSHTQSLGDKEPGRTMRTLPAACTILAAAASAAQRTAGSYRNPAWGSKLSYFARGSCSPEGEASRGENNTYILGLLLFIVAFNFVCFDLTRDAAAANDDELRAAVADALLPDSGDEDMTTLESLEAVYQEETALPESASKMTRLADRCEWNAWNMATITGEYDPDHATIPRWRAQGRAALIRDTAARLGVDEAEVRRRVARRGWMGEAFERDVALAELEPPDGCRTPPRVHYPTP